MATNDPQSNYESTRTSSYQPPTIDYGGAQGPQLPQSPTVAPYEGIDQDRRIVEDYQALIARYGGLQEVQKRLRPQTAGVGQYREAEGVSVPFGYGSFQDLARQAGQAGQRVSGFEQNQRAIEQREPPRNPAEALRYQFYSGQETERKQEAAVAGAAQAYETGRRESSAAFQEAQQRNEAIMREARAAQLEAMRHKQTTIRALLGNLRRGSFHGGTIAALSSPVIMQLADTYNMAANIQPFSQMLGGPDPSSQAYSQIGNLFANLQYQQPDYQAWADPESMRRQWFLPNARTGLDAAPRQQQNFGSGGASIPFQQAVANYLRNSQGQGSGYNFA